MKVLMRKTEMGVNDGKIHPQEYKEGEVYEIGPDLHRAFSGMDIISDVAEKEEKVEYETKVIEPKKTTKKKGGKKE